MEPIILKLKAAQRSVADVEHVALDDLRLTAPELLGYLEEAQAALAKAKDWVDDLVRQEREAEKPNKPVKVKARKLACGACEEVIDGDDPAICSGCGKPICDECMGAGEYCKDCESDEE